MSRTVGMTITSIYYSETRFKLLYLFYSHGQKVILRLTAWKNVISFESNDYRSNGKRWYGTETWRQSTSKEKWAHKNDMPGFRIQLVPTFIDL